MNPLDPQTQQAVLSFVARISGPYDIADTIVYGSRARGTHRSDSDVDVAVILRGTPQRHLTTRLNMADVAFDVLLETGVLISPLPLWLDDWEHPENHANPGLLHNIQREGIHL